MQFKKILATFCINHELDYANVQLLGVLQYLNIAEFFIFAPLFKAKFKLSLFGAIIKSALIITNFSLF